MKHVINSLVNDLDMVQRRIEEDEDQLKSYKNHCNKILERIHGQEAQMAEIKQALAVLSK